ncbi:DNA polymerase III subunit chi [Erythrobacter sp. YT30]|uniref:DNA polymerase III subunit chi n=1 Tax=Erythrobacter sp. YT30 TaxID=1735012 RepID=UPI00076D66ED|nr:DNA polymerase III subunit chi [Erythrobacter sp. YT30]KWV90704.1 DNA polymerase III subunit chi [Erythrobacter sp. YT30]
MKLDFWQLSRDPADKVTALIAGRVLGQDERLLVVSSDAEQRDIIARSLWSAGPTSFLANGEAGSAGAERQPILLSDTPEPANGATHVIFADGKFRDTTGFERAFLLFDDATLQAARQTWKALEDRDGLERSFFRQDGGKWVKVA